MEQSTPPIPETIPEPAPQNEAPAETPTEIQPDTEVPEAEQAPVSGQPESPDRSEQPDIDTLIAQAEQRGYLKAMNSVAATKMNRPDIWQPEADNTPQVSEDPLAANFLTRRRPCVWD